VGKIVRTVVLTAAMAGLVIAGGGFGPAQVKDKAKPKAEKEGTVEVYEDKGGKYRFHVLDADGKTVAMSARGYDKASDAKKALEFVKHTLNTARVTEVKGEKKK
jgi:uncharacterized protein YegP (UPF0339 family)